MSRFRPTTVIPSANNLANSRVAPDFSGLAVWSARSTFPRNYGLLAIVIVGFTMASGLAGMALGAVAHPTAPGLAPAHVAVGEPAATSHLPPASRSTTVPPAFGWQNITAPRSPPPRYGSALVYDPADGYTLVFGGSSYNASGFGILNESWTYVNGTWTNITSTAGKAPILGSRQLGLTYDAHDGYVFALGGGAFGGSSAGWSFSRGVWSSEPAPPVNNLSNPVYDSTDGYTIATTYGQDCSSTLTAATYSYSGGVWTALNAPGPCLLEAASSDDPAAGGVLYTGGLIAVADGFTGNNQTWLFSHGAWKNLTASAGSALQSQQVETNVGMAYDPALSAPVFATYSADGVDTWEFNGTWAAVPTASHPPGLSYPALGWDGGSHAILLFGGTGSATSNTTWEFTNSLTLRAFPAIADPSPVDVGVPTTITAQFQGGTGPWTVNWSLGDGTTGSGASIVHSYTSAGGFTVHEAVTDSTGATVSSDSTVQAVSDISVAASATTGVTDVGLVVNFTATASGGTGTSTFAWNFGDGGTGGLPALGHTFSRSGTYTVEAWANDTGGGTSNATMILAVHAPLAVNFSFTPAAPALGELVNFTATVSGGTAPYSLGWAFGDGGVGGNLAKISHVFTTNGPFSAAVSATDSVGGRAFYAENLTVALNLSIVGSWAAGAAPLPIAFTSHVAGGVPGYAYLWSFGDGATATVADPSHTYDLPGPYSAQLAVTDAAGHVASAQWSIQVSAGGGPLEVSVTATPSEISVGTSTFLTASVAGGTGGYHLAWLNGPIACVAVGTLSERCTTDVAGRYSVTLQVYDSTGAEQAGSAAIQVGPPGVVTAPPAGLELPLGPLAALAGAIALAGSAVVILRARRGRDPPTFPPRGRGPSPPAATPTSGSAPADDEDPLSDLL
ncbi:MAG TPA: PKD domain-containing protein [Thermoplasmata archaeon]|nr:PKD domain-containing protein [Thermoplasmata archaeon]